MVKRVKEEKKIHMIAYSNKVYTMFTHCNFDVFLNGFGSIIKTLYKANFKLIICGDINIDCLSDYIHQY